MFLRNIFLTVLVFNILISQFDWIDDGAPLRQGQHIEWQRTAGDGLDGEIIIGWSDTRDSMRDVYVQKLDANGEKLWGENGIAVTKAFGRQEDPLLVGDGQGGAYVVWIDYRNEPDTKGDVYAQHVLSDGSLVWSLEGYPIVVKEGAQRSPNMCKDGQGGAYIIWKDFTVGQYEHVYATHISADNDVINPGVGVPIMTNDSNHNGISLEIAGNGEAAMAWVDDRNGNLDIYGQRMLADHENNTITTLWSSVEEGGIAICDELGEQNYAKITYAQGCCGAEGVTAVTWQDERNGNFDIYMQFLWLNGDPYFQNYPQGLPLTDLPSSQTKPRVKADNSGAYIIWYSDQNDNADIYAQKIIASQTEPIAWGENGLAICDEPQTQTGARLSTDKQGGAFFVWQDDRNGGDEADVYIQSVDSSNQFVFAPNGEAVSQASLIQKSPVVRVDELGNAFVIWEDGRAGSGSIYAQRYDSGFSDFEDDGVQIYYGVDGKSDNIKSERISDSELLLYWEDREFGVNSTYNFSKIINKDYGLSYQAAVNTENNTLSSNSAQLNAEVKKVDEKLFLGFLQDNYQAGTNPFEGYSQYFQISELPDLNLVGDPFGTWLNPSDFYQYDFISENGRNLNLLVNDANDVLYFTSLSEFFAGSDIYVRKVGIDGNIFWDSPVNLTNDPASENFVRDVFNNQNNGAFIVYDEAGSNNFVKILSIDSDANILDTFPKRVCDIESDQFVESSVDVGSGIFVVWKDNRNGQDNDIYGQYFDYNGNMIGPESGILIAGYENDQRNSMVTYNSNLNEFLVCWEDYSSGLDYDLSCNTIELETLLVNEGDTQNQPLFSIAGGLGDQINVFAYTAQNGNYMIAWEDSRNNSDENLQIHTDIYYQEINSDGSYVYEQGGIPVCDSYHIQTEPKISQYANGANEDSYIIYWSDLRSTGKDLLYNIYGQSITHESNLSSDAIDIGNFSLNSVYPNPFNPVLNINFTNGINSVVKVNIFDIKGRLIENVLDQNVLPGEYNLTWDASNKPSGIYLISVESNNFKKITKVSLLK